jgi:hypothetical protein
MIAAMRPFKAVAAAVLALGTGPLAGDSTFTSRVPDGLPDFRNWERIVGDLEFASPRIAVQYEFFVNPERPATYEVVRYRVIQIDAPEDRRYRSTEKLQWDRDGRDVRRFECAAERSGACGWRELEKGSNDYLVQVPVVMWLYGLHRQHIREDARRPGGTHMASPRRVILPIPGS